MVTERKNSFYKCFNSVTWERKFFSLPVPRRAPTLHYKRKFFWKMRFFRLNKLYRGLEAAADTATPTMSFTTREFSGALRVGPPLSMPSLSRNSEENGFHSFVSIRHTPPPVWMETSVAHLSPLLPTIFFPTRQEVRCTCFSGCEY